MNKYGRTLTRPELQKLYRLRQAGKVTDDMAGSEVLALLDAPRARPGPQTLYSEIPSYIRRKLREHYNLTPTQLAQLPEQQRKQIWQAVIASRGAKLQTTHPPTSARPPTSSGNTSKN